MNEALRNAISESGLTPLDLAAQLSVDPKTVEKWLAGRTPHPRTRIAVAGLVGRVENELWPVVAVTGHQDNGNDEIRAVHPHRWAVPRDTWHQLFEGAESQIDILVYSGLFLAEDTGIIRLLARKATTGVAIRLLLGDPDSPEVAQRGIDEGIGEAPAERIRNALLLFRPLIEKPSVQTRFHREVLYNSLFRGDREVFINLHIYGISGSCAPVLQLRSTNDSSTAHTYLDSFERIWAGALLTKDMPPQAE